MKSIFFTITLFFYTLLGFAQGGNGLGASILAQGVQNLTIRTVQNFPFGSGNFCPPLVGFRPSTHSDTLQIDLLYDLSGAWPAQFCVSIDTISVLKQQQHYLNIRGNSVSPWLNSDTTYNNQNVVLPLLILSTSNQNDMIFGFTNPVKNNILSIYCSDLPNNTTVSIFSIEGKPLIVKEPFNKQVLNFNLSDYPDGLYCIQIETPHFRIVKKMVLLTHVTHSTSKCQRHDRFGSIGF
jgi:hypothetical protein